MRNWIPGLSAIIACLLACESESAPTAPPADGLNAIPSDPTNPTPGTVRKIAFYSDRDGLPGEIYVMNADGTRQTRLTNSAGSYAPSWSPDGKKIAFQAYVEPSPPGDPIHLFVMNADGTGVVDVSGSVGLIAAGAPVWSPDGSTIAFDVIGDANVQIWLVKADGSGLHRLGRDGFDNRLGEWSPDGSRIAYSRGHSGGPTLPEERGIYTIKPDGTGRVQLTASRDDFSPRWSPSGTKIAFERQSGAQGPDIFVMNADGSGKTNITNNPARDDSPTWSPDGTSIAFVSARSGEHQIWMMDSNGGNLKQLTTAGFNAAPTWSPDGIYIAFIHRPTGYSNTNIWRMNALGGGKTQLTTLGRNNSPTWKGME